MRRFAYILAFIAGLLLLGVVAVTAVEVVAMDRSFYSDEYRKLERAQYIGMSHEDLMEVTDNLLLYMSGGRQDLAMRYDIQGAEREVFNQREKEHMVDVRALYTGAVAARNMALPLFAVLAACVALLTRREAGGVLARSYFAALSAGVLALVALAVWAALDFSSFWTAFHRIFFTNDLWILNPDTDVMINMFPQQFFFDCVSRIAGFLTAGIAGLGALAAAVLIRRRARRMQRVKGGGA